MNCLFWHFAGPLEVDDISSQFHLCICDLLLSCMSAHPACCTLDAPCMSDLLCNPAAVPLFCSGTQNGMDEENVNCKCMCISDIWFLFVLMYPWLLHSLLASLLCCSNSIAIPCCFENLYLFRTHHVQDRQMIATTTAKRLSIMACVYWEIYQVKGRGLVVVCMIFPVYI